MARSREPKISVVVPSYNQGGFLSDTLESICLQDYRAHEIIVMDGGSTDESVSVIRDHESKLTHWQSAPDGGQTDAISSGFAMATGDLLMWLNSDDVLLPGALQRHADAYTSNPQAEVFYGDHVVIDPKGTVVEIHRHPKYINALVWITEPYISQPGTSFTKDVWLKSGGIDQALQCVFDYDLWYKFMIAGADFSHVGGYVAGFRKHEASKGQSWVEQYAKEHVILAERYKQRKSTPAGRKLGRFAQIAYQAVQGIYLETWLYRIRTFKRLRPFEVSLDINDGPTNLNWRKFHR